MMKSKKLMKQRQRPLRDLDAPEEPQMSLPTEETAASSREEL
jgi:hypothetical protein